MSLYHIPHRTSEEGGSSDRVGSLEEGSFGLQERLEARDGVGAGKSRGDPKEREGAHPSTPASSMGVEEEKPKTYWLKGFGTRLLELVDT